MKIPKILRSGSKFHLDKLKTIWSVSLYRNAIYLIVGNVIGAFLGFAFWILAARFYTTEQVGLASATIAAMVLMGTISHLGMGIGIVRFLPGAGKQATPMINSSFTISTISSIIISIIFVLGLNIWSPDLLFIKHNIYYFVGFVAFTTATALNNIGDNTLIAKRLSEYTTIRTIAFNLIKVILVVLLAGVLKSYGILSSWGIGLIMTFLMTVFILIPRTQHNYFPWPRFDLHESFILIKYSIVNNIAVLLWDIPARILPIIVVDILGAANNAYFYIAWTIATTISLIANSVSMSLFAEGSNEEADMDTKTIKSLSMIFLVLLPITVVVLIFGGKLLQLFGTDYATNASGLLDIMTITLFPMAVNQIYISTLRVRNKLMPYVFLSLFVMAITLIIAYLLMPAWGLIGAGIGWLIGQTIAATWIIFNQKWLKLLFKQMFSIFS
ncbi:MAG: oligosaccharide flippase family protein [Dehalococcoidales bacterium]